MLRSLRALGLTLLLSAMTFGQSDRGTITGTVSDQAGALIPNAQVVADQHVWKRSINAQNNEQHHRPYLYPTITARPM